MSNGIEIRQTLPKDLKGSTFISKIALSNISFEKLILVGLTT